MGGVQWDSSMREYVFYVGRECLVCVWNGDFELSLWFMVMILYVNCNFFYLEMKRKSSVLLVVGRF